MNYGNQNAWRLAILLVVSTLTFSACSTSKEAAAPASPTASAPKTPSKKGDMKAFSEVITAKAVSDEGLFTVHKVDDKYYFEIPNEMLEREMLLVSRVAGTTQNLTFGGAGQKARSQQVIR